MAGQTSGNESEIDKTTAFWVQNCGVCHPGGGAGEFDRRGELLYDFRTNQFGYEKSGLTLGDVVHDGDYAFLNPGNGDLSMARWDRTGLSEPDCLLCHRTAGQSWKNRAGSLRAGAALVSSTGDPVPAFAAAPAAGQGWADVTLMAGVSPPKATTVTIDYGKGLADGSLSKRSDGALLLSPAAVVATPADQACWGCHATPESKKRGRVWFDAAKDVHYAGFNRLTDGDATNDVGTAASRACTVCHPAGADHNVAKGNAPLGSVRNDTDWAGFRTCRDCHTGGPDVRDPAAPEPSDVVYHSSTHLARMACQFCHVPYKLDSAELVVDNAVTGSTVSYSTPAFLSEDPLRPTKVDGDGRWYPGAIRKKDRDGHWRLFPVKRLLSIWWGDRDDNGTPSVFSDDIVAPVALWRVRGATGGAALPGVTDDNDDGKPEVNRPEEILAYLAVLRGTDRYGATIAKNPALVKGGLVIFEDPANPGRLLSIPYEGTAMKVESSHPFGVDHNVLPKEEALGRGGCADCHRFGGSAPTPVFDRPVLVDPFDETGAPVYETIRHQTGVDPE